MSIFRTRVPSLGRRDCLPLITKRHESSARRTKLKLNVPPTPSMLLNPNSPAQSHIIYNPPSALPSILHTPLKFVPQNDLRHRLASAQQSSSSSLSTEVASNSAINDSLPPSLKSGTPSYHLTKEQILEMKQLRSEDPGTWTRSALAKKFNCTTAFVGIVTQASAKHRRMHEMKLEAIRATWGWKKMKARIDRARRKQIWLMGA